MIHNRHANFGVAEHEQVNVKYVPHTYSEF